MTMRLRDWYTKFSCAFAGVHWALTRQNSFWVHIPVAVAVVAMAAWLNIDSWRWAMIIIAITTVFAAELINTAIEQLVKVVHPQSDPRVGRALDVAAGAVLIAAIGSVGIGLITLGPPLLNTLLHRLG